MCQSTPPEPQAILIGLCNVNSPGSTVLSPSRGRFVQDSCFHRIRNSSDWPDFNSQPATQSLQRNNTILVLSSTLAGRSDNFAGQILYLNARLNLVSVLTTEPACPRKSNSALSHQLFLWQTSRMTIATMT